MKVKAILRSLFLAYLLSGVCLLLLALLVFKLDIGKGPVTVGILVIYVLSCLAGGFLAGKILRQDKYRWGFLVGLCYFVLLAAVSFAVQRKWDMSFQHLVTTFFMCLGGCFPDKKMLLIRLILCYTMPR
jgi:putative membrane protein (TIGR04086 family)